MVILKTALRSAMASNIELWLEYWLAVVGIVLVDMRRTLDILDMVQHVCG
jgi:hypothetical protein